MNRMALLTFSPVRVCWPSFTWPNVPLPRCLPKRKLGISNENKIWKLWFKFIIKSKNQREIHWSKQQNLKLIIFQLTQYIMSNGNNSIFIFDNWIIRTLIWFLVWTIGRTCLTLGCSSCFSLVWNLSFFLFGLFRVIAGFLDRTWLFFVLLRGWRRSNFALSVVIVMVHLYETQLWRN